MITYDEMLRIKEAVFKTLQFSLEVTLETIDYDGVYVKYENGRAVIGIQSKTYFARGITLLAKNIKEGKTEFELSQTPHFENCGAMLDMSRNGVMKVEKVKEYLNTLACLGMNTMLLYTEDTYEIKKHPYFGYMRGRYTPEELREIDDYAFDLGIEVIPCIQTLGHMEQYLRWPAAGEVKDTARVLLCEESKTMEFIEDMIKTMRTAFRSNRIHIGMDEAHDVGLGRYLDKNGYQNRFELLNKHLHQVANICKQYDFQPMMWSDMFFRLGSETGAYYDLDCKIPNEVVLSIPNVDLVYWDYYHNEQSEYERMIDSHYNLGKKMVFAGGIWTWCGFLPCQEFTTDTMIPAMKACLKKGVGDVFATAWEDDGCETNHFLSLSFLPIFSEFCYLGETCTKEDIFSMSEFAVGISQKVTEAFSSFHIPTRTVDGRVAEDRMGKRLFYTDLLYNLTGHIALYKENIKQYEEAIAVITQALKSNDQWNLFYEYGLKLLEILKIKSEIITTIRDAYAKNDKNYFKNLALYTLPDLIVKYRSLLLLHQKMWKDTYKVFGWEVLNARYGSVLARLEYANETLRDYAMGRITKIEELEFEFIESAQIPGSDFHQLISTSFIC